MVHFGELEYRYNDIVWTIYWDTNKAIDIGEWSTCGGGQLGGFYYIYMLYKDYASIIAVMY